MRYVKAIITNPIQSVRKGYYLIKKKLGLKPKPYKLGENYLKYYNPKKNDLIIDCGAYIGSFSYPIIKKVGFIYFIEPNLEASNNLIKNFADFNNWFLFPNALWNKNTHKKLYLTNRRGSRSLFKPKGKTLTKTVKCITLDYITKQIGQIDFIKMDIEGSEIEALNGAINTLKKTRNIAVASYHVVDGKPTFKRVTKILHENGFSVLLDKKTKIVYGSKSELL